MGMLRRVLEALGIGRRTPRGREGLPQAAPAAPAGAPPPGRSGIRARLSLEDHALAGYDEEGGMVRALYFAGTDGRMLAVVRDGWSPFGKRPDRKALWEGALRTVDDALSLEPTRFDVLADEALERRRSRPGRPARPLPTRRPVATPGEEDDSFVQRMLLWSIVQDFVDRAPDDPDAVGADSGPDGSWAGDPTNAAARAGLADLGIAVQPDDGGGRVAPDPLPTLALDPSDAAGAAGGPVAPAEALPTFAQAGGPQADWSPSGGAYDR